LGEKQFRLLFERAKAMRGVTGDQFLQLLETRLDNIVYLLGFVKSRRASRQLVNHGHVRVNGHKVDISSYTCKAGDTVEIREAPSSRQLATRGLEGNQFRSPPAWLSLQADALRGVVSRLPSREEMEPGVNPQLIVEFYSR
jgi:small subunit ribosomal protein S4